MIRAIFAYFIVWFLLVGSISAGGDPYEYYVDYFSNVGLDINETNVLENSQNSRQNRNSSKDSYVVLLTSMIDDDDLWQAVRRPVSDTIIVCDDEASIEDLFSCNRQNVFSEEFVVSVPVKNFASLVSVNLVEIDSGKYLATIIPESFLIAPKLRESLSLYLQAREVARANGFEKTNVDLIEKNPPLFNVDYLFGLEVAATGALLSFVYLALGSTIKRYLISPKLFLDPLLYKKALLSIISYIERVRDYITLSNIGILFVLLSLVLLISLKDVGTVSLPYMFQLLYRAPSFNSFSASLSFILSMLILCWLFTSLLLQLPAAISFFLSGKSKLILLPIKFNKSKVFSMILFLLPVPIVGLFSLAHIYFELYFFSVLFSLCLISLLVIESKYNITKSLSPVHKISLTALSVLSMSVVLFFVGYLDRPSSDWKYEQFIGLRDPVVMLPYYKQLGKRVLVEPLNIEAPENVFMADNFVIHYPGFKKLVHKNIRDLSTESAYVFYYTKASSMAKKLLEDSVDVSKVKGKEYSSLFLFDPPSLIRPEGTELKITLDCNDLDPGDDVSATIFYLGSDGKLKSHTNKLVYFPGCSAIDDKQGIYDVSMTPEEFSAVPSNISREYVVPFDFPLEIDGKFVVYLTGVGGSYGTKLITEFGANVLTGTGIVVPGKLSSVFNVEPSKEILVIFGDYKEDVEIESKIKNGRLDVSEPINELIKKRLIVGGFNLWIPHPSGPVFIRNR